MCCAKEKMVNDAQVQSPLKLEDHDLKRINSCDVNNSTRTLEYKVFEMKQLYRLFSQNKTNQISKTIMYHIKFLEDGIIYVSHS